MSNLEDSVKEMVIKVIENPKKAHQHRRLFVAILGAYCPEWVIGIAESMKGEKE